MFQVVLHIDFFCLIGWGFFVIQASDSSIFILHMCIFWETLTYSLSKEMSCRPRVWEIQESLLKQYSEIISLAWGYSSPEFSLMGISADYKYFINPGLERALCCGHNEQLYHCLSRDFCYKCDDLCLYKYAWKCRNLLCIGTWCFQIFKGNLKECIHS